LKNILDNANNNNSSSLSSSNKVTCYPNPTSYDWKSCGVISQVRSQGSCGSCWAFSAIETVESYCALAGADLQWYSVQQLVNCDTSNQGCGGGTPQNAYQYIESAGGIENETMYPYTAEGGESGNCNVINGDFICTVTGWSSINGESGLYQTTSSSNGGPVSVCVDASSWQFYEGGVLSSCGHTIDHCVQLTGYANYGENGAYWILRNSWGSDWGNYGYIWIAIGHDLCGIGDAATVVTVKVL